MPLCQSWNTQHRPLCGGNGPGSRPWYKHHREDTKKTPPRARNATYPTTALGRCGHCQGTSVARSGRAPGGGYFPGHTFVDPAVQGPFNHKNKGKSACGPGLYVLRDDVEKEVRNWLAREVADDIDNAPAVPVQRTAPPDPRKEAAEAKAGKQRELAKINAAIDRLVTQHALDPEKYPEDSFARVRGQLLGEKTELVKELESLEEVEATPDRADFRPLVVGLLAEWDTISHIEKRHPASAHAAHRDDGHQERRGRTMAPEHRLRDSPRVGARPLGRPLEHEQCRHA